MTIDPYCTVKCEKTQSVGFALKDNPNPVWDQSFVFYPKNPATAKVSGKRRLPSHARSQQCCNHVGSRCWGWGVDGLLVQLVVTVLDKNVLLDSFCGQVRLDVSEYTQTDKIDKAWEITKQLGEKNKAHGDTEEGLHAGTIQLRIQASFAPDL